jgi:hypothetical protein
MTQSTNIKNENAPMPSLTAQNLKSALWETLNAVKGGSMEPGQADAIASQAREILRTTNTQLRIAQQAKRQVSLDVITFSEN